jgi:Sec-independent protein translocase protein TatA
MGLGTGLPLLVVLGFLVLGPKRMQELLKRAAKAKAELERSSREIKSHLAAEIDGKTNTRE